MITREDVLSFKVEVIQIRKKMIQISQNVGIDGQEYKAISEFVLASENTIDVYIAMLDRDIQRIKSTENQSYNQPIIFEKNEEGYEAQKNCLYLWQIINFLCINSPVINKEMLPIVSKLLMISIKYEVSNSPLTIKNALISVHNSIAKMIKTKNQFGIWPTICRWVQEILVYHFERQLNYNQQVASYFKFSKSQEILVQQTEWIAYIFSHIFSNSNQLFVSSSFLEMLENNGHYQSLTPYYALHMIGNFFQDMIDKRVTSELVAGFECQIKDVKDMYQNKGKSIVQIKINRLDLGWICRRFNSKIDIYLQVVKEYIGNQISKNDNEATIKKWKIVTDYLQQFSHILNCILFIGGYNKPLQDFIVEGILQNSKSLLEYFQISYLLYRNIESTKYQTKVNLMVEMEKEAKKKLLAFADVSSDTINIVQIKDLKLDKLLANGQLVSILRLLSNLIHINHRAQIPFQNQPKYLHMVLSLTHDSVSQATMKEWAIMFIRNVSQWSQKLREEIKAVKVQMKVK